VVLGGAISWGCSDFRCSLTAVASPCLEPVVFRVSRLGPSSYRVRVQTPFSFLFLAYVRSVTWFREVPVVPRYRSVLWFCTCLCCLLVRVLPLFGYVLVSVRCQYQWYWPSVTVVPNLTWQGPYCECL
jgi:small-conductance mechanosensitive channel